MTGRSVTPQDPARAARAGTALFRRAAAGLVAVPGADGSFACAQLPAGTYTIAAWHEKYGVIEQTVTIADNEAKAVDFDYSG